ncbi:MAG: tRNA pseudouridine(13) synthase TruD [Candidatus Thermoplasmatota archaeon]|nr:tRNA pseudouridine(13) synthase TruD [Euryarchaeota archaeon]MBU4070589.1 tRNA pseudouridine(13) synthase TruD [Candidatus Thermoplasmatota archaeon]MBU4143767.1 tRNA pseudouridine(13) synthase TruD [Candidatus Thermoplasmatota archaeon]MBU4591399.1 tRNA pseudouridine(13) synthase TruD [Candidatus Thermoplasmatota archaeon]
MTIKDAGEAERLIGLECFFTPDAGIGGRLRAEPEDFVVEELSVLPKEDPNGVHTAAIVRARYWETNRLIREFARRLRCSRKKIMFAGTKDKRAVTTQLFVFGSPINEVKNMFITDVEFLRLYPTNSKIGMGDLLGNKFDILLKDMDTDIESTISICESVKSQLDALGGFPNYFGVQRFGAVRPITHTIGKHMTRKEPEQAVMAYLCHHSLYEHEETRKARMALALSGNIPQALHDFPDELSFEKAIMNHLVNNPDDFIGALGQLPQNLMMMFIHAYQSHLFNRMLSERMRRGIPFNEPVEGDFILKMDKNGLPDHENWVVADARNIPRLTDLAKQGKAFVSATLYGMDSEFAGGEQGEIEAMIVEQEGVKKKDFILSEYEKLGSYGTRREILAPCRDFTMAREENAVRFGFRLNKGCYATTLLREFMKCDELTKY